MTLSKSIFVRGLLFVSLCACSKNSANEEDHLGLNYELEIIDSIQVDVMESITAMDFKSDRGLVYSYQSNMITVFDADGKTLKSKTYPKEGPGSVGFVTNLRFLDNGDILLYPFGNRMVLLDPDLEVKKNLEMPFPAELHGAAYFQYMFAYHGDDVFLFYPGRDGGNPYLNNFYKDYKMLEKLNLKSGISEASYKLPENSKYQSDLTYDYPTVTLSAGKDKIYVALDTESLIHIYDPKSDTPAKETLDRWVESAVGAHLINQSFKNKKLKIYYWREGNDEVDFVVEYKKRIIALDVKTAKARGLTGLNAFDKNFRPEKSLLIGTGGIDWQEFLQMDVLDLFS